MVGVAQGKRMVQMMMDYEDGSLSETQEIELFSDLISSGMCWKLQGFYGRAANSYIQSGIIDKNGKILVDLNEIF